MLSAFDEEQIIGNASINAVGGQQKLGTGRQSESQSLRNTGDLVSGGS